MLPSSGAPAITRGFGGFDDLPIAADFVGDGKTDFAVHGFSPLDGFSRFAILPSNGASAINQPFGAPGMIPLPPSTPFYLSSRSMRSTGQTGQATASRTVGTTPPDPIPASGGRSKTSTPPVSAVEPIHSGSPGNQASQRTSRSFDRPEAGLTTFANRVARVIDAGFLPVWHLEDGLTEDREHPESGLPDRLRVVSGPLDRSLS